MYGWTKAQAKASSQIPTHSHVSPGNVRPLQQPTHETPTDQKSSTGNEQTERPSFYMGKYFKSNGNSNVNAFSINHGFFIFVSSSWHGAPRARPFDSLVGSVLPPSFVWVGGFLRLKFKSVLH